MRRQDATGDDHATTIARAGEVLPAGTWDGAPADTVRLDFDFRHRRRVRLTGETGVVFLLDLPEVPSLREGDGLRLDDGRIVAVRCAAERLLEVHARDARTLARLAWHLGNRHLPTEIATHCLRVRADHVIEAMLQGLGASVRHVEQSFHPEGGAYGHGRTHGHGGHAHRDDLPAHHHDDDRDD